VHDDRSRYTVENPDLVDDRGVVGSDDQREALVELKDADWLFIGSSDVLVADAVLAGTVAMTRSTPTTTSYLCFNAC
jgi:hypothetical protein